MTVPVRSPRSLAALLRVPRGRPLASVLGVALLTLSPLHSEVVHKFGEPAHTPLPARTDPSGPEPWTWTRVFEGPRHVSLLRAQFASTTHGLPLRYRWESKGCEGQAAFTAIEGASDDGDSGSGDIVVRPRRKTWFVDVEACAVRLTVTSSLGAPALESVEVVEGARDVLRTATIDDGAEGAIDGTYEGAWTGTPGKGRWTLTAHLPSPTVVDRVRLVLGTDAVSIARPKMGRNYAIARAPLTWTVEASEDGQTFAAIGSTLRRADGSVIPARRPLVTVHRPRPIVALRLVMEGATNDAGLPDVASAPTVREIEAYGADDAHPILAAPWVLSVNANPAASSHGGRGGELANDVYFAKFLQMRFSKLIPALEKDDRFARALGPFGELVDVPHRPSDGQALEAIEGDDPNLDEAFLRASWPPPIAVLSGSNDWDYARKSWVSPKGRVRWNPLVSSREGGMGDLASAVKHRAAPMLGFCGGMQILALLEARDDELGVEDEIDQLLRRNTGRPIRGVATEATLIRSWPGEGGPRRAVSFVADDPLFADIAGASMRARTFAFPESHLDEVRPEAFAKGGPLASFDLLATSLFCSPAVVAALHDPSDPTRHDPLLAPAHGRCSRVPEVFRAKHGAWPIVGSQFHAEQRDFDRPAPGDPPESIADARLFVAAAYEQIVDAYLRH